MKHIDTDTDSVIHLNGSNVQVFTRDGGFLGSRDKDIYLFNGDPIPALTKVELLPAELSPRAVLCMERIGGEPHSCDLRVNIHEILRLEGPAYIAIVYFDLKECGYVVLDSFADVLAFMRYLAPIRLA